jgi:hypothetical protein
MTIQFAEHHGTYTGTSRVGRCWRITRVLTGWQLEFRDEGDTTATYAGVHRSVAAAQTDAAS